MQSAIVARASQPVRGILVLVERLTHGLGRPCYRCSARKKTGLTERSDNPVTILRDRREGIRPSEPVRAEPGGLAEQPGQPERLPLPEQHTPGSTVRRKPEHKQPERSRSARRERSTSSERSIDAEHSSSCVVRSNCCAERSNWSAGSNCSADGSNALRVHFPQPGRPRTGRPTQTTFHSFVGPP